MKIKRKRERRDGGDTDYNRYHEANQQKMWQWVTMTSEKPWVHYWQSGQKRQGGNLGVEVQEGVIQAEGKSARVERGTSPKKKKKKWVLVDRKKYFWCMWPERRPEWLWPGEHGWEEHETGPGEVGRRKSMQGLRGRGVEFIFAI